MSDEKDKDLKEAEELQKMLKSMFGKMGGDISLSFPHFGSDGDSVERDGDEAFVQKVDTADAILDFNYNPRDVKAYLDRYVIRQDEAKKALSIAVCDHYNHAKFMRNREKGPEGSPEKIEYQKQNVMVVGPTGVGKTYLIKHIAEMIGVPFVKADATKFSETGYVGGDVDDLVRELVKKADGDVELAEYGIIYIDEVDKIASRGGSNRDVGGRGVQTTLLKLMEETEVSAKNPNDMRGQMMSMMDIQGGKAAEKETVNTRHILFIVSGAFSGLEDVIKKRLGSSEIGFGAGAGAGAGLGAEASGKALDEKTFEYANTQDFIDFGFEAEFIGRLPVRVVCEKLEAADFVTIMKKSEGSLLRQYEREFAAYGIQARFEDSAIEMIAEKAETENTGARALMTVCEKILRDFKFELPGTAVNDFRINADLINNSEEVLAKYRAVGNRVNVKKAEGEVSTFCKEVAEKHSLNISFSEEAVGLLADESSRKSMSVLCLCQERFKDYQFGLKLIQKNTGQNEFVLCRDAINDADKFLSDSLVASYTEAAKRRDEIKSEVNATEPI